MATIPEDFKIKMKTLLQDDYPSFLQSFEQESEQGLRINLLKTNAETFRKHLDFKLEPVPWCPIGFYYSKEDRPGKHPYHAAGVYYIQEPSAMSVVEFLEPKPGDMILDLCAAPGGKSTHIAAYMQGEGLLVSNEIHPSRVKALSENIERCGVTNALVTNETPERLAPRFPAFFDRILVDAPCSGEGMFRKLDEACEDWSGEKIEHCASMQADILEAAATMLKPGGILVYSTCTFSPEENEKTVARFLEKYPSFELEEIPFVAGMQPGRPDWASGEEILSRTIRLWPHQLKGEGHFVARLRKNDGPEALDRKSSKQAKVDKQAMKVFEEFCHSTLTFDWEFSGEYLLFGEQLYAAPSEMPSIDKLKVTRPGWHLGTIKKSRFEPSHALALGLKKSQANHLAFSPKEESILRYLRGEALMVESAGKGWTLVCVDAFPIGWGKLSDGQLKNHYPKGLRWP